ncbi:uncharacterized protein A4U43_C07F4520 [Asparagus officinalis]|uniref:Uncharacterized protein n=1 Tax=Asparagus officinalis TaxID=4686 RepID=A0A5P1E9C6_ASPOF|nr:uncharacterized protein A4U43_C07F4520 [Asparagus officinalis]
MASSRPTTDMSLPPTASTAPTGNGRALRPLLRALAPPARPGPRSSLRRRRSQETRTTLILRPLVDRVVVPIRSYYRSRISASAKLNVLPMFSRTWTSLGGESSSFGKAGCGAPPSRSTPVLNPAAPARFPLDKIIRPAPARHGISTSLSPTSSPRIDGVQGTTSVSRRRYPRQKRTVQETVRRMRGVELTGAINGGGRRRWKEWGPRNGGRRSEVMVTF